MLGVAYDTFAGLQLLANFRIRNWNWNRIRIRIRIKHEAHIRLPETRFTTSEFHAQLGKATQIPLPLPPPPPPLTHCVPFAVAPPAKWNVFFVQLYLCIYENVANI